MRTVDKVMGAMATVCCLVLASCASGGHDDGAKTGTLEFYTDKAAWAPDFDALNAHSTRDADIDLKTNGYSDADQYKAFVKQSFRTDESPGLFTWQTGSELTELVDEGLVAETSDIWDKALDKGWISPNLRDAYTIDGKQYCVPMNIAYWVMYYNKNIFEEHDLEEPRTWSELTDISQKLTDAGVTPYYQTSKLFTFPWFQQLVAGTDPDLYQGLADGTVKYTDPRIVEIMQTWSDQQAAGWFSDVGSTIDPAVGLKQGDYAMMNFGSFFNGSLDGAGMKSGKDYDMFVIPAVNSTLDKTPVAMESGPLCVAENSSQKTLGLHYSQWWVSPDAQTAWSKTRGDVAFNPKSNVADPMLEDLGTAMEKSDYAHYDRYLEAMPAPIRNAAIEQFGAFMADPRDPAAYLETIQAEADKYWAKQG